MPDLYHLLTPVTVFAAMLLRGMTGFGAGLILTPLLSQWMPVRTVVALTSLIGAPNSAGVAFVEREAIDWRAVGVILPAQVVGVLLGAHVLTRLANDQLRIGLGAVVLLFAVRMVVSASREAPREARTLPIGMAWAAGALGGLLGALFGTGGPPIVLYLTHRCPRKQAFRATVSAVFMCGETLRMAAYWSHGLMTLEVAGWALPMLIASALGTFCGHRLQADMEEKQFRRLVGLVLLLAALNLWRHS